MYQEEFTAVAGAAKTKAGFLKKNPLGYFLASMLAGAFVGFGILLIFSIGGQLTGLPYAKTVMGVSFGIALSLVIIAGSELFTGNNLVMTAGIFNKTVTVRQTVKLWIVCYIGNWIGSALLAVIFVGSGLATGATGEFIAASAATKMSVAFFPLLLRGVLCNVLVCLAVWCNFRCKSESGKLIMIFWCLFAFITSSFEHSIANMTLLTVVLFAPFEAAVSFGGYFYNILVVTLGNMLGGILFIALPYFLISQKKEG
jgi:nitrite transporter NirC